MLAFFFDDVTAGALAVADDLAAEDVLVLADALAGLPAWPRNWSLNAFCCCRHRSENSKLALANARHADIPAIAPAGRGVHRFIAAT